MGRDENSIALEEIERFPRNRIENGSASFVTKEYLERIRAGFIIRHIAGVTRIDEHAVDLEILAAI